MTREQIEQAARTKIGEIRQVNGEWYQCTKNPSLSCKGCAFHDEKYDLCELPIQNCTAEKRSDCKDVIFKKLEKVGEPYSVYDGVLLQPYRIFEELYINQEVNENYIVQEDREKNIIAIEIKQNKEDMKEKKIDYFKLFSELPHLTLDHKVIDKDGYIPCLYQDDDKTWIIAWMDDDGETVTFVKGISIEDVIIEANNFCVRNNYIKGTIIVKNTPYKDTKRYMEELVEQNRLKPFDLEAAKSGKPVCTRDGRKARIICFDKKGDHPIIALIENKKDGKVVYEEINFYFINGRAVNEKIEANDDLMMLPEKKEGWVIIPKATLCYTSLEKAKEHFCDEYDLCIKKIEWVE